MTSQTDPQLQELEELLERLKNLAPLSRQEVCDHYKIELKDFPRFAQANCEREREQMGEMKRVFRGRRDKGSVAVVRRIDRRSAEVRRSIYWSSILERGGAP
jgi:hypothetical protein